MMPSCTVAAGRVVAIVHARAMPYVDVYPFLAECARVFGLSVALCFMQARMNSFELVALFSTALIFFIGVFTLDAGTHMR